MNMHRVRRLASAAVVAALAVTVLSACRSQPTVAAYVGNQRITEARVQTVWDDAKNATATAPLKDQQGDALPFTLQRADVVRVLTYVAVLQTVAKQQSVTAQPLDPNQALSRALVPATSQYTQAYAQELALLGALQQKNQSAPPAPDADLRELQQNLIGAGVQVSPDFASFKSTLSPDQTSAVNASVAVGQEIDRAVTGPLNVRINPRYGTLTVALLDTQSQQTGMYVPLLATSLNPSASPAPVSGQS